MIRAAATDADLAFCARIRNAVKLKLGYVERPAAILVRAPLG
jgi:hypothetical protein